MSYVFAENEEPPRIVDMQFNPDTKETTPVYPKTAYVINNTFGHKRQGKPLKELDNGSWLMAIEGQEYVVHPADTAWTPTRKTT